MTRYDAGIIQAVADRMYRLALIIQAGLVIIGIVVGGLSAHALGGGLAGPVVVGILLGGIVGWVLGWERALAYRFRAQTALCQARIEEHLHRLTVLLSDPADSDATARAERLRRRLV